MVTNEKNQYQNQNANKNGAFAFIQDLEAQTLFNSKVMQHYATFYKQNWSEDFKSIDRSKIHVPQMCQRMNKVIRTWSCGRRGRCWRPPPPATPPGRATRPRSRRGREESCSPRKRKVTGNSGVKIMEKYHFITHTKDDCPTGLN